VFSSLATGAARRAYELHRRMPPDIEFVAFVTKNFPAEWKKELENFRFVETSESRSFTNRIREASGSMWRRLLDEYRCAAWVTDTIPVPDLGDIRTCVTVHDLRYVASRRYVDLKRYLMLKLFMKNSLSRADLLVTVSQWTGRMLEKRYPAAAGKLRVVPNAVDPEAFASADVKPRCPYLLTVGHMETRKNLVNLVKAFAMTAGSWSGCLLLVGRDHGSLSSVIKTAEALGVADRLEIMRNVDSNELPGLYRGAEMVVCPSRYEGFGLTLLEGMAAGRPVIASEIPPHREVAADAALYFHPDDADALAEAILRVLNDRALREELVTGGARRLERFSWKRSAEMLESVYRELVED